MHAIHDYPANATGSSNDIGFEAAGQYVGLVPGGMPRGPTSPVGYWQVANIEPQLADLTAAGATDEPRLSVVTLGVEAL